MVKGTIMTIRRFRRYMVLKAAGRATLQSNTLRILTMIGIVKSMKMRS